MNISSIIIRTKKEHLDDLIQKLKEGDICEYHLDDGLGNIVVTIEGEGVEEEIAILKKISALTNVISAEMAFSYSEQELDGLKEKIEQSVDVPEWLNKEGIDAKDINYGGRLKKDL